MIKCRLLLLYLLLLVGNKAYSYKLIAPQPFFIVRKNYLKLQVLPERGDRPADSVFFDVLYNTGSTITRKSDQSLSLTLPLNEFNDGVFFIRARVYHQQTCDTLISKYSPSGIPVLLDRQGASNTSTFQSQYVKNKKQRTNYFHNTDPSQFVCNNNKASFLSAWDEDSLYFDFKIQDAHLNYATPSYTTLFQAKDYLKMLWNSDCIEIGFDLLQNRSEWKGEDDYELLIDVKGNFIGNRWSVLDSFYTNWGSKAKVTVITQGSVNNNEDTDKGYVVSISIPWSEIHFNPGKDQSIGFDLQFYDKDGMLDDAFRTSISNTNPESNDNTSEWASLVFKKNQSYTLVITSIVLLLSILVVALKFRPKTKPEVPAPANKEAPKAQPKPYSETIQKAIAFISANYPEPGLSRQEIAESVFLSEQYLSSLFKKEVGENLVLYINKFRVEKAIELLQTTKLSISEIAFKVGYNSIQNFNKNFKTITQKAPSEYRKDNS